MDSKTRPKLRATLQNETAVDKRNCWKIVLCHRCKPHKGNLEFAEVFWHSVTEELSIGLQTIECILKLEQALRDRFQKTLTGEFRWNVACVSIFLRIFALTLGVSKRPFSLLRAAGVLRGVMYSLEMCLSRQFLKNVWHKRMLHPSFWCSIKIGRTEGPTGNRNFV